MTQRGRHAWIASSLAFKVGPVVVTERAAEGFECATSQVDQLIVVRSMGYRDQHGPRIVGCGYRPNHQPTVDVSKVVVGDLTASTHFTAPLLGSVDGHPRFDRDVESVAAEPASGTCRYIVRTDRAFSECLLPALQDAR